MWRKSDKKQKQLERGEGALGSHKLFKKRAGKMASTQQGDDSAISQLESPVTLTAATSQSSNTDRTPPSTSDSGNRLSVDSPVVMFSPYCVAERNPFYPVFFSKELLVEMDHNKHHLEIDLFRPELESSVFPPHDLSPLCLYRDLRTLKITGMMRSYQPYIWLVVWLNPQLTDLTLAMAGGAQPLCQTAIAQARKVAKCKPSMREVAQGKTKTEIPRKFQLVTLSLTNFAVHDAPFRWFSEMKLQKLELHHCEDNGFQLPMIMQRSFNVTVTM